ncbi:MAG: STAS domain-containing protein [Planctomycetota bacterium]|jgi:anti-sigma B factor antagonist
MEPVESKLKIEHAMETTFVTLQETHILEENQIKQLEEQIMPVVEKTGDEKLILNFANVQFMSSAFLGLLVKIHKRVSEQGGHLALCKVDPTIYKVFEITNLTKVFQIL